MCTLSQRQRLPFFSHSHIVYCFYHYIGGGGIRWNFTCVRVHKVVINTVTRTLCRPTFCTFQSIFVRSIMPRLYQRAELTFRKLTKSIFKLWINIMVPVFFLCLLCACLNLQFANIVRSSVFVALKFQLDVTALVLQNAAAARFEWENAYTLR